jgi:hypothetical protein
MTEHFGHGLSLRLLTRHAAVELKDAGALVDLGQELEKVRLMLLQSCEQVWRRQRVGSPV